MKYYPPRYLLRRHIVIKKVLSGDKFLEIGAGKLLLSTDLLKYFKNGTCLDFAPGIRKLYKELPEDVRKRLTPKVGDFFKIKLPSDYDCVIACEVMEHVKNDRAFINRAHELLKPGGQIIISVPAKEKYWTVHDEIVGHVRRYEKNRLEKLFNNKKFENVKIISYGYPFINVLWLLRWTLGKIQAREKKQWSSDKQTKESGIGQIPKFFDLLGIISNKYVFYIPNKISELFNRFDLSEGYIITANRKN